MSNNANVIHKKMRIELENYIKSQYFGKSPILMNAIEDILDDEGLLYRMPFIESSPAYESVENGLDKALIAEWMRDFFSKLAKAGLGVYSSPYKHQIEALESGVGGEDLFVATGTGSGKTECFMWPLLAKLADEARNRPEDWKQRGLRAVVMYPMNALVSDQVSRLRRLIGDSEDRFISIFRNICGFGTRRPQFGMYTGRTPYPGEQPTKKQDSNLAKTMGYLSLSSVDEEYYNVLLREGKIPSKKDIDAFIKNIKNSEHKTDSEDAELITRFEMQKLCPDILITNYSMLEYMLMRPIERKIWDDTKKWLERNPKNKLLFIIDEAHMYRGSSGGEVSLLLRRLFYKLGINRNRVQFILTTASMPHESDEDKSAVERFAYEMTVSNDTNKFRFITGTVEEINCGEKFEIPLSRFKEVNIENFEENDEIKLRELNKFWNGLNGCTSNFKSIDVACVWMYENLLNYRPFFSLINKCRGNAVSINELYEEIFPDVAEEQATEAISTLLAIAPLAKNSSGSLLFPARMHMLFKGLKGVYACTNENCPHAHSYKGLKLGEIFFDDFKYVCPHCNSVVYELYNDRRCGALFFKGYILERDLKNGERGYLWQSPGYIVDKHIKEIMLFIPEEDYKLKVSKSKNPIKICYLDTRSGFINLVDDSWSARNGVRKLYYCNYEKVGRPDFVTFTNCPHCHHQLSEGQLTGFNTKGNQSFFNLIKTQFLEQSPVCGKDDVKKFPNQGRKVLVFSDSRQRAAKLARDMSEASEITAVRQLFVKAIKLMEETNGEYIMDDIYDFFRLVAYKHGLSFFTEESKDQFFEKCEKDWRLYERKKARGKEYNVNFSTSAAPKIILNYILRMFAGGYNTLYDAALCWLEPKEDSLEDSVYELNENGIEIDENEFLEIFNAWLLFILDRYTALGNNIDDSIRMAVRRNYYQYGVPSDWSFPKVIKDILGWDESRILQLKNVLDSYLAINNQGNNTDCRYISLDKIIPRFNLAHKWYRCEKCSEITPFSLFGKCPICGSSSIHVMEEEEYGFLDFWRKPVMEALDKCDIRVINTEEHTAQLSHKDQRDNLWSQTEQYELRFQDLLGKDETPVDILSCTTTMEVGIDIGSLVAVGLRNIPPMRENYQQRAGRAGRRGAKLSTIVTFCEDGPHDTKYFNNPVPMLRGEPRRPWIDVGSEKLYQRHITIVMLEKFLESNNTSLDRCKAYDFIDNYLNAFLQFSKSFLTLDNDILLPSNFSFDIRNYESNLRKQLYELRNKRENHPEIFGVDDENQAKSFLDALYEEGMIPTFSFPKHVVSTYITEKKDGWIATKYEVDRDLNVAISEYAPGRAIVVDKKTYQIGGFYYPGSERINKNWRSPAKAYVEDPNYVKDIRYCPKCKWFGLAEEKNESCPFCGNSQLTSMRPMLRPWGFGPKNACSVEEAQLKEEYSFVQQPQYSTLPNAEEMSHIEGYKNIRMASRSNQRIIMLNKGYGDKGFMVCCDCGASMPGDKVDVLKEVNRPYMTSRVLKRCNHNNVINVNIGHDFVTDMFVLEFSLDKTKVDTDNQRELWLDRSAISLAEALRLVISKELDIEFSELITGYRIRYNHNTTFVDVYIYDNLSSGAGYAIRVADIVKDILKKTRFFLMSCKCKSACFDCLKHYRNQMLHGRLDRFAALNLLNWGEYGELPHLLSFADKKALMDNLKGVLDYYDYNVEYKDEYIFISHNGNVKKLIIYPAMINVEKNNKTIYISDKCIEYARPYALEMILNSL